MPHCPKCDCLLTPSRMPKRKDEVGRVLSTTPVPFAELELFTCKTRYRVGCGLTFFCAGDKVYATCQLVDHRLFHELLDLMPNLDTPGVLRRWEEDGYSEWIRESRWLKDWRYARKTWVPKQPRKKSSSEVIGATPLF